MPHRLSRAAARDIRLIFRQSILQFGVAQAERYLSGLEAAFESIAKFPDASPERPEYRGGIRIRRYESHHIIYRLAGRGILIVRVLHGRQDLARYL